MQQKEWIAMLLAGGQGSRLGGLTRHIAKPALSFGGKYRIIDFALSNCVNSNIDTVGVLTQYKPFLLNAYVGIGAAWDLDNSPGGLHVLPPFVGENGGRWYKGTANAIYENMDFVCRYNPSYVLIISGDHIYRMDYEAMLAQHKAKEADLTIAVMEVPWEEAPRFGIMNTDSDQRILQFQEKPAKPESNLASMGIYIFSWPVLKKALLEDEHDTKSEHDFGQNIIPKMIMAGQRVFSYRFEGYWRDVGTVDSYYEANMELLKEEPAFNLYDNQLRIFSDSEILPPQYIGEAGQVSNCLVGNGCTILGTAENCILSSGVTIEAGAMVCNSVLLPNALVMAGAQVETAIIGERSEIVEGCRVGRLSQEGEKPKITVVDDYVILMEDYGV